MRQALLVKIKLGFIDGTCLKSSYKGDLANQWERCNAVVLSWIAEFQPSIIYASNARKVWNEFRERFEKSNLTRLYHLWTSIGALKQGTDSVTQYYSKLKDLWDEMDLMIPTSGCDCEENKPFIEKFRNLHLLQFLVGLNESYSHVRSNVLLRSPTLTVNQAYTLAMQEESQRTLGMDNTDREPLTMLAGRGQGLKPKKPGLICEHCGYKGHLTKNCYRIIGFPSDFKSKKKAQGVGGKSYANVSIGEAEGSNSKKSQGNFLTEEQYKQLMNVFNKS
ncbi:uncharacterized protein LOC142178276 [Nicotiana tabacum]|uniref:Uncharacterized protein LOC142178276 n=1 Tax=Nicotiana tabacum TaxID=4097 RepID=A0AC58U2J7_TOBAC